MKDRKLTMNIGIISLMIVFVILCLITFAVLSLASANSNLSMTEKGLEHTTNYYDIASDGEKILKEIDDELYCIYQECGSAAEYYDRLGEIDGKIKGLTVSGRTMNLEITKNDLKLIARLEATYPGEALYELTGKKVVPASEWNPDYGVDIL